MTLKINFLHYIFSKIAYSEGGGGDLNAYAMLGDPILRCLL